jgi:Ca2+-binding RTX toxin-like protein
MNDTKSLLKRLTQIAMAVLLVMAIPAAQAAKSGGGKISVTAASPGEALQGEELEVIVSGTGFDEGTTAIYLVTGTSDEDQIEVLSTEFVDANQLKTRIRVKGGATIIDYDIQATNSRGRRGKGTTLFSVKQSSGGSGGGNPSLGDDYTATNGVTFISPSDVGSFDYHIIGTPGEDEIYAGGGRDLIEGFGSKDTIWARGGDDEIQVSGGQISGGAGDDFIIVGDEGSDFSGDEGDDILIGGNGGGAIIGGKGTDWLEGGGGEDWLFFSLGALIAPPDQYELDYYDGGPGKDYLIFDPRIAVAITELVGGVDNEIVESVTVDLSLGTYLAMVRDPFGTLVTANGEFLNIEAIYGSDGDDILLGTDNSRDQFNGGFGDDIIYTYGGDDMLWGGPGIDVIHAGPGNDDLNGGSEDDTLYGEGGNDTLYGYDGNDELHGGEGCDGYIFRSDSSTDTIMDFEVCELIYFPEHSSELKHLKINISDVGNDIIIELLVKRHSEGTIILKNAALNGITVDESTFIFAWPDRWCGSNPCYVW